MLTFTEVIDAIVRLIKQTNLLIYYVLLYLGLSEFSIMIGCRVSIKKG